MAERFNPAEVEQYLLSLKLDPGARRWNPDDIKFLSPFIAYGNDSLVFHFGPDEVIKVYMKGVDLLPQLEFYREVTNRASQLFEQRLEIVRAHGIDYPIFVNPIREIYAFGASDTLCAISKLVKGKALEDLGGYEDTDTDLHKFGESIASELGVEGIDLAPYNVIRDVGSGVLKLVITDLCTSIPKLRKK
jgi:hypothetical protein